MKNKFVSFVIVFMSILLALYFILINFNIFILHPKINHGVDILNWFFYILFFVPLLLTYLFTKWKKILYFILIIGSMTIIEYYILENSNIYMSYETWIKKGMPDRPNYF